MLDRVTVHPRALQHATEELRGDREIVVKAVSHFGFALQFATEELKCDRELVMAAVCQAGRALRYATEELRGDREIVMTAVSQNGSALQFATKDLKEDEEMLQHALEGPGSRGGVIGLKVALLSGRCCSEIFCKFSLPLFGGDQMVLRRCAASLDLDPDYVESSVASSVWRSLDHLQSRNPGSSQTRRKNRPSIGESNQHPPLSIWSIFLLFFRNPTFWVWEVWNISTLQMAQAFARFICQARRCLCETLLHSNALPVLAPPP